MSSWLDLMACVSFKCKDVNAVRVLFSLLKKVRKPEVVKTIQRDRDASRSFMLGFFREKARWIGLIALIAIVSFLVLPTVLPLFGVGF